MVWHSLSEFENPNAVRTSTAGDGLTEPNHYFCNAKMQTNPIRSTKNLTPVGCEVF